VCSPRPVDLYFSAGRKDPLRGEKRLITRGRSTHAGWIDPGRIDRHPSSTWYNISR